MQLGVLLSFRGIKGLSANSRSPGKVFELVLFLVVTREFTGFLLGLPPAKVNYFRCSFGQLIEQVNMSSLQNFPSALVKICHSFYSYCRKGARKRPSKNEAICAVQA